MTQERIHFLGRKAVEKPEEIRRLEEFADNLDAATTAGDLLPLVRESNETVKQLVEKVRRGRGDLKWLKDAWDIQVTRALRRSLTLPREGLRVYGEQERHEEGVRTMLTFYFEGNGQQYKIVRPDYRVRGRQSLSDFRAEYRIPIRELPSR